MQQVTNKVVTQLASSSHANNVIYSTLQYSVIQVSQTK